MATLMEAVNEVTDLEAQLTVLADKLTAARGVVATMLGVAGSPTGSVGPFSVEALPVGFFSPVTTKNGHNKPAKKAKAAAYTPRPGSRGDKLLKFCASKEKTIDAIAERLDVEKANAYNLVSLLQRKGVLTKGDAGYVAA